MNILITGAGGFVGKNLTAALQCIRDGKDRTHPGLRIEKLWLYDINSPRQILEEGCREVFLYGGTGGVRLDHTLANLQSLLYLRRRGARGWMYDRDFLWTVIENETLTVERTVEWGLLSAFCLTLPYAFDWAEGKPFRGCEGFYRRRLVRILPGYYLCLGVHFAVALAVSLAHAHHISVMLKQQKQIVEMNAKLQELVHQDPLTGLLNKTTVECWAEQLLQRPEQTGEATGLTLFLVDLDEFKEINDRYGHPCGDYVLVETAEALRRVFPDATSLGRIGGDEFAILYSDRLSSSHRVLTALERDR